MITSITLLLSVLWAQIFSWINISGPLILFGLYYGFLTTLPMGPSQILSTRAFLLEGNLSGLMALGGSILGQLIIFLSIYYSPLYVILLKPHAITLLTLPYILFYWYKIKDLSNYQSLRPITSTDDTRIFRIFLNSFLFQIFNPILLPSPILTRLVKLFLFRYSHNFFFVISLFCGWLGGNILFLNLSKFFLVRIKNNSSTLYLLVKRVIYRTFSIIILVACLSYLGRAPVPFSTKKWSDESSSNQWKAERLSWLYKPWPTSFFDYRKWNRPLRYIENSRFSNRSPVKKNVSQYFFNICLNDGRQRISFTSLPSFSNFEKDLKNYLNVSRISSSSDIFYREWINTKKQQKDNLYSEVKERIKALDNGSSMEQVTEKRVGFSTTNRENIPSKIYDPFLNGQFRGRITISQSPLLLTEKSYKLNKTRKLLHLSKKNNKLKFWISNRSRKLERKDLPLPWEPLTQDARRVLILLIQGLRNNKSKIDSQNSQNSQKSYFSKEHKIEQKIVLLDEQKVSTEFLIKTNNTNLLRRKAIRKSHINWELVLNLSLRQRRLYFNYLEKDKWETIQRSWKNLISGNFTQVKDIGSLMMETLQIHKDSPFQEVHKEVPRWTSKLKNEKFDVIAIGVTDIRQRKVKNLGYLIKGREKRRKIVRRFSQQSDFRRKLIKGSMRARRRKTLIWKILQLKTHSPFFLKVTEKPASFRSTEIMENFDVKQTFVNTAGMPNFISLLNERKNAIKRTKADRLAIANRWDFPLAQWGRSWLLIIQSYLRKYVILPVLIVLKNMGRLVLLQVPEWNEDWNEWNEEIHIKCTYDGTEVSEKELPEQWLKDGLQIKIIYPFHLKPWHNSKLIKKRNRNVESNSFHTQSEEKEISDNKAYLYKLPKNKKFKFSFLTAWGFQTDLPFGNIKKQPYFWKPVSKELKSKWKRFIFSKTANFYKFYYNVSLLYKKFNISNKFENLTEFHIQTDERMNRKISEIRVNYQIDKSNTTNNKIINKSPLNITFNSQDSNFGENEDFLQEIPVESKYRTTKNIKELESLIISKNNQLENLIQQNYFDEIKSIFDLKEKNNRSFNNTGKLNWRRRIIRIYQAFTQIGRRITQKIKKEIHLIQIILNNLNRILKESFLQIIRNNLELLIKLTRNLSSLREILSKCNQINIFHRKIENNRIVDKHLNVLNKRRILQMNTSDNIILIPQAYIYHKAWQIKTMNKCYLKYLLQSWTPNYSIKNNTQNFLQEILSFNEPQNLTEKNWKKWLRCSNRYNLPSQIWYKISPQEWKDKVSEHWKSQNYFCKNSSKKNQSLLLHKQKENYSIFASDSSSKYTREIGRLNKRHKSNLFLYSYLDHTKSLNIKKFPMWQNKEKETLFHNRIKKIKNFQLFNNERNNENLIDSSKKETNLFFRSNLILWLVPEFLGKKNLDKTELIPVFHTSLIRDKNRETIQNVKSLRERERHQSIRQWRWKSKNLEKRFKELGDMASVMTFIQNQKNIISLSAKMREDLDLFRLPFRRDIGINRLTINSEHRLPRVLDDQILMYKIITTLSKFQFRFKERLDLNIFDESILRIRNFENEKKTIFNSFSIEEILLPKHRRELRILNSLFLKYDDMNQETKFHKRSLKNNKLNNERLIKINKEFNTNVNQSIKRFLWPSYRLEDLACMNRFWFNTSNGSRFSMLRIRIYLSIHGQ
uniref:Protein TIC 214 n=1 Tax=Leiosporoceros dussii TaxID=263836 RepID=A0A385KE60_9EMBR|nr:hypothetical chloroplast RF1 [Leiosporoceros dussii]AXZ70949.1 hypothetical chloroplast RF1 [Leiosporoceros dussii]